MCGYIGQISLNTIKKQNIDKVNELIKCRGPDEICTMDSFSRNISFQNFNQYFKFNRLSIVDLNSNAMQPMYSEEAQSLILFNGEIFNHVSLRKNLEAEGIKFETDHSDTEVLLKGLSLYGLDFIQKINGQFAIVFFDYRKNYVYLIRDRMGQKPLFYFQDDENLLFSSNLKSLIKTKIKNFEIDTDSINDYLNYGVIPSPKTIFKKVYKVRPSQVICFQIERRKIKLKESKKYWNIDEFANSNEKINKKEFREKICDAIDIRQNADVPVANFLSGGIDSTYIVKTLSENKSHVNTFSAVYEDLKYDESQWSNQVAKKYNTKHYSKLISNDEINSSLLNSIKLFDEPYSDPSTLPSYLLSKSISEKFKVAVSGDGGDELLGGYKRVIDSLKPKKYNKKIIENIYKYYPSQLGTGSSILNYQGFSKESYTMYYSDKKLLDLFNIKDSRIFELDFFTNHQSDLKSMLLTDYKFYLQEMMMLKVDRTSMANSLEIRSPFIDHRLVEYMLSRNEDDLLFYINKKIIKNDLAQDFGEEFTSRKKMGFVFNLEDWIYNNQDEIFSKIKNGKVSTFVDVSKINSLYKFKTRINSQRIWKFYFLSIYLEDIL